VNLIAGFFLLFLLGTPAMAAKPDITYCTQAHDAAVARLRWVLASRRYSGVLKTDESCRTYRSQFYEAAVTRQNITHIGPIRDEPNATIAIRFRLLAQPGWMPASAACRFRFEPSFAANS
jgi:hypothetical protein